VAFGTAVQLKLTGEVTLVPFAGVRSDDGVVPHDGCGCVTVAEALALLFALFESFDDEMLAVEESVESPMVAL